MDAKTELARSKEYHMPDYNAFLSHPQIGPTLAATTWVAQPVVGATTTFMIKVTRKGSPISNATVTLKVVNQAGMQVYPVNSTVAVPADPDIPGTYSLTPASLTIFTTAGALYKATWLVTVPASGTLPALTLPVVQTVVAQSP